MCTHACTFNTCMPRTCTCMYTLWWPLPSTINHTTHEWLMHDMYDSWHVQLMMTHAWHVTCNMYDMYNMYDTHTYVWHTCHADMYDMYDMYDIHVIQTLTLSLQSILAPLSTRTLPASVCPKSAVIIKLLHPPLCGSWGERGNHWIKIGSALTQKLTVFWSISAPWSSKVFMTSQWPSLLARMSGVHPACMYIHVHACKYEAVHMQSNVHMYHESCTRCILSCGAMQSVH